MKFKEKQKKNKRKKKRKPKFRIRLLDEAERRCYKSTRFNRFGTKKIDGCWKFQRD